MVRIAIPIEFQNFEAKPTQGFWDRRQATRAFWSRKSIFLTENLQTLMAPHFRYQTLINNCLDTKLKFRITEKHKVKNALELSNFEENVNFNLLFDLRIGPCALIMSQNGNGILDVKLRK